MKVLLILPPIQNRLKVLDEWQFEPTNYGSFPPLGLLYIATFLKRHVPEAEIRLVDCAAQKTTYPELKEIVRSFAPDVVGMTVFSHCLVDVLKVARLAKSINPHTHICLGGHHLTVYPHQSLEYPEIDSIVIGEGEEVFSELVRGLMSGKKPNTDGLYFKADLNEKHFNKAVIRNIDSLPFFDVGFLNRKLYYSVAGNCRNVIPFLSSRGCPFSCNFCATLYKVYRGRSIENIISEIKLRLEEGFSEVFFFDDTFNITPQRVIDISRRIIENGLKFRWSFRARASAVTFEMLRIAKEAGCERVRFGVETGTDDGLRAIKKEITVKQIEDAMRWCRKLDIASTADYIIGFPFEKSKEEVKKSIKRLIKFSPDFAQVNVLQLIPGSEIYDLAVQQGVIDPSAWENFVKSPSPDFKQPLWEEYLTREDLKALHLYAYRKFYFRPSYIMKTILSLNSIDEFKGVFEAGTRILLRR